MAPKKQNAAKRISSDTSITLIVPSDYQHIYSNEEALKNQQQKQAKRISSDTPTALIEPSDYRHVYTDEEFLMSPKQNQISRIPSYAPTELIVPSDYKHIFAGKDPHETAPEGLLDQINRVTEKSLATHVQKRQVPKRNLAQEKKSAPTSKFAPLPKLKQPPKTSSAPKTVQNPNVGVAVNTNVRQYDAIPKSVVDFAENFIKSIPKEYTIVHRDSIY